MCRALQKHLHQTALVAVLASILNPTSVQAATPFLTEKDVMAELPLVSAASRMEQQLNRVPASVTIIDRELIDASGAQNWVDIFRLVPGFQAYSINGNRAGINYHGVGREFPNHLEVMVDGRSIYEPIFSSVSWPNLGLSLEDVDYIEIVRGSNAPAYGSNAFLGAVNIVTRKPVQDSGLHASYTNGNRHTRNGSLRYNSSVENLDYRVTLNYLSNDGFPAVTSGDSQGPLEDGRELIATDFRGMYTPNISDTFDLQAGYTHNNLGWGDSDHPDEYADAQFKSHYQSLKWTRELESGNKLQLYGYHNRIKGENFDELGLASAVLSDELGFEITPEMVPAIFQLLDPQLTIEDQPIVFGFRQLSSDRYDIELEHHITINEVLRTTWGAGYRHEFVDAEALLGHRDGESLYSRRLFSHVEWLPTNRVTVNAGVFVEDNNLIGIISSARLAANIHLNDNHTLRAGYAKGRRSPSVVEANEFNADVLDGQLLIQSIRRSEEDITEERLTSYELGYLGHLHDLGLTLDIRLFREELRDGLETFQAPADPDELGLVVFNPDDDFSVRSNLLEWDMTGVELQLRYQPSVNTLVTAHYGYRDVDSFFIARFEPKFITNDLNNRGPRHTAGLLLNQKFYQQWSASLNLYHISDADWRDGNAVSEFTRVDAQLKYHFTLGSSNGNIALIGQNLGDDYSEHGQNNIFDTRVYLKFTVDFP